MSVSRKLVNTTLKQTAAVGNITWGILLGAIIVVKALQKYWKCLKDDFTELNYMTKMYEDNDDGGDKSDNDDNDDDKDVGKRG